MSGHYLNKVDLQMNYIGLQICWGGGGKKQESQALISGSQILMTCLWWVIFRATLWLLKAKVTVLNSTAW